ncbi:protein tramtrack, alpha isoform-like [Neodiprion fabricii]|uniref:protein tramtrack, alpha isoform-like n=1 Tax=Neodiprion fabricii TaxID=2872261 RepID=UPI001ED96688|nr:protein tramtrack, alpha isoform-like [Neodiprion fabricii]
MNETEEVQLNLKWDNFSSHLALSFDSCYESQQFVDVSLVCKDGEVIKGHKMILANTSKFFRRLLTENEHPHPMIVLHNIDADDLRSLMTFMYCGEVQVFQNDLKKLLEIADTLEITGLQQIQELDSPAVRFGVKNYLGSNAEINRTEASKNNMDYEGNLNSSSGKPASNLLKYVSSLGQKNNSESSLQPFESSSKKLQEMAQKFEKCSRSVGSWSFLQQAQNGNGTRIQEIPSDCDNKKVKISQNRDLDRLEFKSSSQKLQEMAKLLENVNHHKSSEASKEAWEGQKRSLDFDNGVTEPPAKKSNMTPNTLNTSELEPKAEIAGRLSTVRETLPGRSADAEDLLQNCVFIKDEVDVATDCSTASDVDLDNSPADNLLVNNTDRFGSSMLAAELLKAVANKRKDSKKLFTAIRELTFEVQRQSYEIQELRNCLQSRGFLKIDTITVRSFAEEYGISLQLQTVEEFKDFDLRLKNDGDFCAKFVSTLEHLLEKEIQKSITSILKSYVSRDLATSCTAIRRSNDKMIFKGTKFNDCLFALICQYHRRERNEPLTEKEYYQALSSCLSNAKDWHGFRSARKNQSAALRRTGHGDRDDGRIDLGSGAKVDEFGDQDSRNAEHD